MSSQTSLQDKMARFADLDRPDEEDEDVLPEQTAEPSQTSGWKQEEREYRRRSREFAAAASKKRRAIEMEDEPEKHPEQPEKQPQQPSKEDSQDDDVIILPGPPPPKDRRLFQPRRTASAALQSPAVTAATATIRRTASNPLPEGEPSAGKGKSTTGGGSMSRTSSSGSVTSRTPSGSLSKSARAKTPKSADPPLVPEKQRIFQGLSFYYIPDSNLGPRKLRIAKARSYGAHWVRQPEAATHVIVDKELKWDDIEKVVAGAAGTPHTPVLSTSGLDTPGLDASGPAPHNAAGRAGPHIVKDDYPLDCISFGCLLNPDQRRYRLAGYPTADTQAQPTPTLSRQSSSTVTKSGHHRSSRHSYPSARRTPPPQLPRQRTGDRLK